MTSPKAGECRACLGCLGSAGAQAPAVSSLLVLVGTNAARGRRHVDKGLHGTQSSTAVNHLANPLHEHTPSDHPFFLAQSVNEIGGITWDREQRELCRSWKMVSSVRLLASVGTYLSIGVLFFTSFESKPCESIEAQAQHLERWRASQRRPWWRQASAYDPAGCTEPWTKVDALYFCTASMST
eukprot:2845947-Prymnesium_polylepis.1